MIAQLDIKAFYRRYKEQAQKRRDGNKANYRNIIAAGRFFADLEKRIERSNIRFYISYNAWLHLFLCLLLFLLAFSWMEMNMEPYVALIFGALAALLPYILLQLFSDIMGYKVKRMSVDFLIIMRRFLIGGKGADIFEAFKKAGKYVLQPLKNYVELMAYEYEHKVNPIQCFDNLKDRLENSELKLYIENLKICYIRGGDVVALTDTFIEELDRQNDDDDEESAQDTLLSMGLYMLLAVNFLIIYIIFNSSYKMAVFDSGWGQIVFTLDLLVSFYIAYLTLEKVY